MMYNIKPTRSELIKLRKRIKLAYMGYSLLKRKKDGLVQEFFTLLEDAKKNRSELAKSYVLGVGKLELARAMDGIANIESTSFAVENEPEVSLKAKNLMGVVVPKIEYLCKENENSGYGVIGTSSYIEDVVLAYDDILRKVLASAELDTSLKKILLEIEKTKRRVNALECIVIPNMEHSAAFIRQRLEEMERENIFRLKRVKKKKGM